MTGHSEQYDFVVVGGGAAGFFGALAYAEEHPAGRVMILEKGNRLLAKVLVSGGGRCNVTHAMYDPAQLVKHYPRGSRELLGAFSRFQPGDTAAWFEQRGVRLKTEADGRIFPVSDSAVTIASCLIDEARRLGIEIRTQASAAALARESGGWRVGLKNGPELRAGRVLLATGGAAGEGYALAGQQGHTIQPPVPSLFTFKIKDERLVGLAGVSVPNVTLRLAESGLEQSGPLLVTHWGLSGPAVLKLSAWGARVLHAARYQAELLVHWLPGRHRDELYHALGQAKNDLGRQRPGGHDPFGVLPQRLWRRLVQAAGIEAGQVWGDVSKSQLNRLADELARGTFRIEGKGEFKEEFVTCGGVTLKEINFKTMESRLTPGLYLAGELLDIDGLTGGFNFQSAWTTGWLAGKSAAAQARST